METVRETFFSEKQKKIFGGLAMLVYLLLVVWIVIFIGRPMVRFASQPELFREWVNERGTTAWIAYLGMVCLQVFVAVIPGEPLEIGGGYAFGILEGSLLCLIGVFLGSIIVFAFVRSFGMKLVEIFFSKEKIRSLRFLRSSKNRDVVFFFLFMLPGTPKDLLCYFAGLTDMKWTTWLLICSVGRLPSILTSTIGGDALGTQDYWFAVAVFGVTMAVSLIGMLVYRKVCQRREKKQIVKSLES